MLVEALIEVFSGMLSALTGVSKNVIEIFYHKKQILKDDKKKQEELNWCLGWGPDPWFRPSHK